MARRRMIKPEFWTSETLARVSRGARLTFVGLWNHCDDYGVIYSNIRRIIGEIYPLDETVTDIDVRSEIEELVSVGLLLRHRFDGRDYLIVRGWDEHQRVDKPSAPIIPIDERNKALGLAESEGVSKASRVSREDLAPEVEVERERELKKEQQAAPKKEIAAAAIPENPEQGQNTGNPGKTSSGQDSPGNTGWIPIPQSVEILIGRLVELRRKTGVAIKNDPRLRGYLRDCWRRDPVEVERWEAECAALELEAQRMEEKAEEAKRVAEKRAADMAESDEMRARGQSILRQFDALPIDQRRQILARAKVLADAESGPDTPWLYAPFIETVMNEELVK